MEVLWKLYGIYRLPQGSPCNARSAIWVYDNTNKQERGLQGLILSLMRYGLKRSHLVAIGLNRIGLAETVRKPQIAPRMALQGILLCV